MTDLATLHCVQQQPHHTEALIESISNRYTPRSQITPVPSLKPLNDLLDHPYKKVPTPHAPPILPNHRPNILRLCQRHRPIPTTFHHEHHQPAITTRLATFHPQIHAQHPLPQLPLQQQLFSTSRHVVPRTEVR